MTLRELINNSNQISRDHGFWDDSNDPSDASRELATLAYDILNLTENIEDIRKGQVVDKWMRDRMKKEFDPLQITILSKLVLIVSEVGEAIEAVMNKSNVSEEMSDLAIRWADLSKFLEEKFDYESEQEIDQKSYINSQRPRLHGKKA